MAKNKKQKLYYVTGKGMGEVTYEEFILAPKRRMAEKLAANQWGPKYSVAATRVRLKDQGFLNDFKKNAEKI